MPEESASVFNGAEKTVLTPRQGARGAKPALRLPVAGRLGMTVLLQRRIYNSRD